MHFWGQYKPNNMRSKTEGITDSTKSSSAHQTCALPFPNDNYSSKKTSDVRHRQPLSLPEVHSTRSRLCLW